MLFSRLADTRHHHHRRFWIIFITSGRNCVLELSPHPFPPPLPIPPRQLLVNFVSLQFPLLDLDRNEIKWCAVFWDWLLPHSFVVSRRILVVACVRCRIVSFMAE